MSKFSVTHIAYKDDGGAGKAACRYHLALLDAGIESNMLVIWKNTRTARVFGLNECIGYRRIIFLIKAHIENRYLSLLKKISPKALHPRYWYLKSIFRIENHPLVTQADIIHLHWIDRTLSYRRFFKRCTKPMVWSLHDLSPLSGSYHYQADRLTINENVAAYIAQIKRDLLLAHRMTACVTTQSYLTQAKDGAFFADAKKVYYPISPLVYHYRNEKQALRQKLQLPISKTIILFVAVDNASKRKGMHLLTPAITSLCHSWSDIVLLSVGNKTPSESLRQTIELGHITDESLLADIYNCADLLVTPAQEEAFGQTTLEALLCGLPVVSFATDGGRELIEDGMNGYICPDISVPALTHTVERALASHFCPQTIAQHAARKFSAKDETLKLIEIYQNHLKRPSLAEK